MKRIVSVLLSVLMIFSCLSVVASAAVVVTDEQVVVGEDLFGKIYQYVVSGGCDCEDHVSSGKCTCCVLCPSLDTRYLTSCAKDDATDGGFDGSVCCTKCTGVWPCTCGCSCCADELNEDIEDKDDILDDYWTEDDQENFIDGFQAILKQISDAFDRFFDAIFAFLRLDEILGRTE